ncbi:MAG: hypothetical protein LBP23_02305 [Treponema sp.]|nr:hypothetical protein [Treponema sp.]
MKNVLALARSLGLPADKFSVSVISSARYFSLPLEPGLLAKLRREVSAAGGGIAAGTGGDEGAAGKTGTGNAMSPAREALSLGAAAAVSKGVTLYREALDESAAAIEPGRRRLPGGDKGEEGRAGNPADGGGTGTDSKTGSNGGRDGGGGKSGNDGAAGSRHPESGGGGPGAEGRAAGKNGASGGGTGIPGVTGDSAAGTEALKECILGTAEKTPLLRLLNRIPGKNGRRWIVLPFAFTEGGKEYGISLRIMLEGDRCRMALDMAEKQNGETLYRWLFVMERVSGKPPSLTVSLWPGRREAELRSLKKELGAFLELPRDHIQIKNADNKMDSSGFFPQGDLLLSVNEEV